MIVSGLKEILKSKIDPFANCSKIVIVNLVLCAKCGICVYGRCAKMKRVTLTLARGSTCERCVEAMKGIIKPAKKLTFYDPVELVKSFCYLGTDLMPVVEVKGQ